MDNNEKTHVQRIPINSPDGRRERPESGVMCFERNDQPDGVPYEDWNGYFLRGKHVFALMGGGHELLGLLSAMNHLGIAQFSDTYAMARLAHMSLEMTECLEGYTPPTEEERAAKIADIAGIWVATLEAFAAKWSEKQKAGEK